jgi:WD40 repeat protein
VAAVDHPHNPAVEEMLTPCHQGEVGSCAFAPRLAWAVSGGWDGQVLQWDLSTGDLHHRWQASAKAICAVAVTPDGGRILTGDVDGHLVTWDALSHHEVSREVAHLRPICGVAVSGNGRIIATCSWDSRIKLRYLDDEDCPERTLTGHKDIVAGMCFWPDGKRLLTWSPDGTARTWETVRGNPLRAWAVNSRRLTCGDVSPSGQHFAVGGDNGTILIWDVIYQTEVATVNLHEPCCGLHFAPDGGSLIIVTANATIIHAQLPEVRELHRESYGFPLQTTAMPVTGEGLALGGLDGTVRFQPLPQFDGCSVWVTPVETLERRAKPGLGRLFGQHHLLRILRCSCPFCGHLHDFGTNQPPVRLTCPGCHRELLLSDAAMSGQIKMPPA